MKIKYYLKISTCWLLYPDTWVWCFCILCYLKSYIHIAEFFKANYVQYIVLVVYCWPMKHPKLKAQLGCMSQLVGGHDLNGYWLAGACGLHMTQAAPLGNPVSVLWEAREQVPRERGGSAGPGNAFSMGASVFYCSVNLNRQSLPLYPQSKMCPGWSFQRKLQVAFEF